MYPLDDCEPSFKLEDCTANFDIENCGPDFSLDQIDSYFLLEECAPQWKLEDCLPPIQITCSEKVVVAEQQNIRNFPSRNGRDARRSESAAVAKRTLHQGLRVLQLVDETMDLLEDQLCATSNSNVVAICDRIAQSLDEVRNDVVHHILSIDNDDLAA